MACLEQKAIKFTLRVMLVQQIPKAKIWEHKSPGKYLGHKASESCMSIQASRNFKYLQLMLTFILMLGRWPQICLGLPLFFFSFFSLLQYVLSDHIVRLPSPKTQIRPNNPENLMNFSCACYTQQWGWPAPEASSLLSRLNLSTMHQ